MPYLAPRAITADQLEHQLRANLGDAERLVAGLAAEQLTWRPGPERWSIADCLEHLATTDRLYLERMRAAIEAAAPRGDAGEKVKLGLFERWFIGSLEPPSRLRVRAPKLFQPENGDRESPRRFAEHQREVLAALAAARAVDLETTTLVSPASRWVRLRLGSAFALLAAHQRRHLLQARRVAEHPELPG